MLLKAFVAVLIVGSLISFVLYGADKAKAKRHAWRIPEKVLLLWGFLCGSVGALAAMQLFRHKTKHWYFWAVNVLGLAWQIALAVWLFQSGL
jgi:uncharacterized membrane protein YsdA (DUF1294 family)